MEMEEMMEFSREIYWNVGHGAATLVPMYLLTIAALAVLVYGFRKRIEVYRQGLPLNRTDQLGLRIGDMLRDVLLQKMVIRVAWPGLLHGLFFWGFFLLFIGTTLIVIQADFTDLLFGIKFLKGTFYKLFSITLDIAGLVAILMLVGLWCGAISFPRGAGDKRDDAIMHGLLFAILITGFVIEGARMAVTEMGTPLAPWSPVGLISRRSTLRYRRGRAAAPAQTDLVVPPAPGHGLHRRHSLHQISPYLHHQRQLCLRRPRPRGKLVSLDLESEDSETFGATSHQGDDLEGHLRRRCLHPVQALPGSLPGLGHRQAAVADEDRQPDRRGRLQQPGGQPRRLHRQGCHLGLHDLPGLPGDLPGGHRACPQDHRSAPEHGADGGRIPRRGGDGRHGADRGQRQPLGIGYATRGDWAEGLGVKASPRIADVDILYFVGCYASFDKRNIAVARSFVRLCQAAGVKVGILGKEEKCCGEPMRKMGNEYLYQTLAAENIELIKGYGVKKVVTTCPHCFNTLAKDYRSRLPG
jgi:hypothetical protein